ncbi:MAG: type II toxin-antitoxin system PrlF family antitoxin [Silvanigrellales bacterium]|nr:type II toxin-antitoxin system PrlF family antitoxin [Silvanigrellales bacterium]
MAAPKLTVSSLTSKFQATIPREVRDRLQLKAGDKVRFILTEQGEVVLKKATPLDVAYLSAVETTLTEWNSPEDEEAFSGL